MELTDWRQLSDRGPDLVLCLDFPGGRAAAGFAETVGRGFLVEAALRDHPAVADAVAVAVPDHALGSVVGAQVVLRRGASVRKAELAAHCGRRLAGYKIPKQFTFVDQVPRSAAGKVQRWRLAPPHENGAVPP